MQNVEMGDISQHNVRILWISTNKKKIDFIRAVKIVKNDTD